jgi:hypothetical protein
MDAGQLTYFGAASAALLAWIAWLIQRSIARTSFLRLIYWQLKWDLDEISVIEKGLQQGLVQFGDSLLHKVWHASMLSYAEYGGKLQKLVNSADYARRTFGFSLALHAFSEALSQPAASDRSQAILQRSSFESRRQSLLQLAGELRQRNEAAAKELEGQGVRIEAGPWHKAPRPAPIQSAELGRT